MIYTKHLHKYYGDLHVLNDVELHIAEREIVSIVGASGAGKTTLLQILGTLDFPSDKNKGELRLKGVDVYKLSKKALAKFRNEHIGFIFQFHQLLPEFTALENICIPAFIKNTPKKQAERKAMELLDFLGLKDRAHHKPSALSGGEQQRVAVARALANDPEIDRKSTRLNSSHVAISYAVFCWK